MYCSHCKQDKSPHLFFPCEMSKAYPRCRKCCAQMQGHEFGSHRKQRAAFRRLQAVCEKQESLDDLRRAAKKAEQQRLVEQRAARLAQATQTRVNQK